LRLKAWLFELRTEMRPVGSIQIRPAAGGGKGISVAPFCHEHWLLKMITTAYRIGDDTYKDFTGGKPVLQPACQLLAG
jgi:hypothetical protein